MYAEEIYYALDHNLTECLHSFYNEYANFRRNEHPELGEPLSYEEWIKEEEKSHKTENLCYIKDAIIRYVEYEGSTLEPHTVWVAHEHWSDFMRVIKDCVPFKSRKSFNALDYGFELHFDATFGISFKFDDILGYFMTWEEFCDFYKKKVYDWENDKYWEGSLYS